MTMQSNEHDESAPLGDEDYGELLNSPLSAPECAHNPYTPVDVLERGWGRSSDPDLSGSQPRVLVLPWRSLRGWPGSDRGRGSYRPLVKMLTAPYVTDAHFVQYSAPTHPFRLLSTAYEQLPTPPSVHLLVADVDSREAHAKRIPATDAWFNEEHRKLDRLLADMPGAFVYRTTGGYRIVYTLREGFVVASEDAAVAWKRFYVRSLVHLAREYDIVGDATCKPWNWLFRVPRATRRARQGPETPYTFGNPAVVGAWTYVPK